MWHKKDLMSYILRLFNKGGVVMSASCSFSFGANNHYHQVDDNDVSSSSVAADNGQNEVSSALLGMLPEHVLPELAAVREVLPDLPTPIQRALIKKVLMHGSEAALSQDAIIYEIAWRVGFDSAWQFDNFTAMCSKIACTAWPMDCEHECSEQPPQDVYYVMYKALKEHTTPFANKLRMGMAFLAAGQLRDKLSTWNGVDQKNTLAAEDWDDPELMRYVVQFAPDTLRFASDQVRDNIEVVKAAVKKRGSSLQFASERLRDDIGVVMAALAVLKNNKHLLGSTMRQHPLIALSEGGLALRHASRRLRGNKEVVRFAVQQCGHALEFASAVLQDDEDIVWSAYQQGGKSVLGHASERLRDISDNDCCIIL